MILDNNLLVPIERVERTILLLRGQKVILDADLEKLYGVTTKRLNQQVKRNSDRFPEDFMIRPTQKEKDEVVANCHHLSRPKITTKQIQAIFEAIHQLMTPPEKPKKKIGYTVKEKNSQKESKADPLMQEDETKVLAKRRLRSQKCPYCGVDRKDLAYGNVENDGKEVFQVVDCTVCEKQFTEVYSFCRVILTDYPGEDFRIDFND